MMQHTSKVFKYLQKMFYITKCLKPVMQQQLFKSKLNTAQCRVRSEKSCLWSGW